MYPKIIAHRGASRLAPENTMPAFKIAHQQGAEGIETDVQLTKDNIPVLIHDERVKRTTNSVGYVKNFTFKELKQLDAGSWFSQKFVGTPITSLEEFLQWVYDKSLYLNLELKNNKIDYRDLEAIVYERIEHYQLLNSTTISSFNPNSLKRMREINNDIEVALLLSRKQKNLVRNAQEIGANAIHLNYRLLNHSIVKSLRQANMAIRIFTVNKQSHLNRCIAHGCDGVFTDVPGQALNYRRIYNDKEL
ncbi:glycerophosphoryl diester phosphodiesterase [Virgibacillus natechei]|uniref:Glycerophosphoryl diester phosphodiesterase n=1 Tax=Virgibacillus natechei TaxID=1216297 RepID=A0ABS4IFG8_9BACI|nr:glycerophosphodiester phosphodiesterase [Virgibacillus natechei]MBP1969677.1 glycerophosphoryl diester phosphodiesterase [Virgibacillus natechei]UZD11404.1 glycerophosphodiester phosphodiesterase [Virgibacillus natechei]